MRTGTDVSAAVRATLAAHLPAQLAALTRPLPAPSTYAEVPDREMVRRVKDVSLAISVPGFTAPPSHHASGWAATFSVVVSLMHTNTPATPVFDATNDYGFAIAATLQQHPSLGDFADSTDWLDWSVAPLGDEIGPGLLGLTICEFSVRVSGVIDETAVPSASFGLVELVDVSTLPQ